MTTRADSSMGATLHVVTHARWVAADLAARAPAGLTVTHSLGLDLPRFAPGDALWAPTGWAARARRSCGPALLPLADPGPTFLPGLPETVLGRAVGCGTLDDVAAGAGPEVGFFKAANVKIDQLPAAWRRRSDFTTTARALGAPGEMAVLWSDTFLDLVEEHRVFILDGQPVTSSPYLQHHPGQDPVLWHEHMASPRDQDARAFAAHVLDLLPHTPTGLPPAFVLDVALTRVAARDVPEWVVLEANPVWSSAQYGADPGVVIACLLAANSPAVLHTPWTWRPDPYLVARADRQRTLRWA